MARVYKTKQKDLILQSMQNLPNQHITAEALAALLREGGEDIGLATVYRNLDKLVQEGLVLKYTLPNGMRACYQYMDNCKTAHLHFHLLCTQCGNIQHLECGEMDELAAHMLAQHHFTLDDKKTVFYGICATCSLHTC